MYVLHSSQGHVSGFQDLINFLNLLTVLNTIWHKLPDFWAKISYRLQAIVKSFYVFSPKFKVACRVQMGDLKE